MGDQYAELRPGDCGTAVVLSPAGWHVTCSCGYASAPMASGIADRAADWHEQDHKGLLAGIDIDRHPEDCCCESNDCPNNTGMRYYPCRNCGQVLHVEWDGDGYGYAYCGGEGWHSDCTEADGDA